MVNSWPQYSGITMLMPPLFKFTIGVFNTFADPSLYTKRSGNELLAIVLYVDIVKAARSCSLKFKSISTVNTEEGWGSSTPNSWK